LQVLDFADGKVPWLLFEPITRRAFGRPGTTLLRQHMPGVDTGLAANEIYRRTARSSQRRDTIIEADDEVFPGGYHDIRAVMSELPTERTTNGY
jgi:hypothetical protein